MTEQRQFRRVVVSKSPNPTYHGHTGDLIRYLSEMDGTLVAEIRWDKPFPISNTPRQVITVDYLTALDSQPLGPEGHIIQEET